MGTGATLQTHPSAAVQNTTSKARVDVEGELRLAAGGNAERCSHGGKQFLINLNIQQPGFLGIYPKELKTYTPTKTHRCMLIAALFLTGETWKQPRWPSVGDDG